VLCLLNTYSSCYDEVLLRNIWGAVALKKKGSEDIIFKEKDIITR
jgi:hypothetical protein